MIQSFFRLFRSCAALGLVAVLVACASDPLPRACPRVSSLADAREVTRFAGDQQVSAAIIAIGRIGAVSGTCDYDDFEVDLRAEADIIIERGPAGADTVALPLFVAVMDNRLNIVSKQVYERSVRFAPGQATTRLREVVRRNVPLPGERTNAESWQLLIGFQLTEAELAYNRARAGRTDPQGQGQGR